MPRYVRQHDLFRCGPIGILNALKWAGVDTTVRLIPDLCRETKCTPSEGTLRTNFARALVERGKKYFATRQDKDPILQSIESSLRAQKAVLLCFLYDETADDGERPGHYVLITHISKSGKTFTLVNHKIRSDAPSRCIQYIRRSTLLHHLRRRKRCGIWYPIAWHLTPRPLKDSL